VKRVMTVERRAWREEEEANEEIGTALRGGSPCRTQSWQGHDPVSKRAAIAAITVAARRISVAARL